MFDSEVVEVAEHHGSSTSVQIHFLKDVKLMLLLFVCFFSIWVFFHEHSRFTGQQGKGRISL